MPDVFVPVISTVASLVSQVFHLVYGPAPSFCMSTRGDGSSLELWECDGTGKNQRQNFRREGQGVPKKTGSVGSNGKPHYKLKVSVQLLNRFKSSILHCKAFYSHEEQGHYILRLMEDQ